MTITAIAPPLHESRSEWMKDLLKSRAWNFFLVESPAGESFLKSCGYRGKVAHLNEHTREKEWLNWRSGLDDNAGLISDFGFPVLGDPGWQLIRQCHQWGIKIRTLGIHSPVMATLVMSGCDANRFIFAGYLQRGKEERREQLQSLFRRHPGATVVCIETPYRFHYLLEDLIELCPELTWLSVGINIGQSDERCYAKWIEEWKTNPPKLEEKPLGVIAFETSSASKLAVDP